MEIGFIFRKSKPLFFSIEKVYESIFPSLGQKIGINRFFVFNPNEGLFQMFRQIWNLLKRKDLDFYHLTGEIYFLAAFLPGRRTIITIHDCNYIRNKKGWKGEIINYFWFLLPVRKCRHIIAISDQTKSDIIKFSGCSADKITVIPNPINAKFSYHLKPFDQDGPVILQVGTRWNKNVDRVLQAITGIKCNLFVLGPLTDQQIGYCKTNNIVFENRTNVSEDELVDIYRLVDMLVFVSLSEGFGLPIIEAQATGRPVITSDLSPMKDVSGGAALLVDPQNILQIRKAIQDIINDAALRKNLIDAGLMNVEKYQAEYIASRYYELYRKLKVDVG